MSLKKIRWILLAIGLLIAAACGQVNNSESTLCGDQGNGAYFYAELNFEGNCFFVKEGTISELPFSPKSVGFIGEGVNASICKTKVGEEPCTEVNEPEEDLTFSSIANDFQSAKIRHSFTSDCEEGQVGIWLFSEDDYDGNCRFLGIGTYNDWSEYRPRSLKLVGENVGAKLCNRQNLKGECTDFDGEKPLLGDSAVRNEIGSVEVYLKTLRSK